ncbi:MAG: hypothetical protein PHH40_04890, partial [Candidatus Moranbacteria bacterium]|nr:hypothetical protein [Candidatus Moranbacteria bacterium]MDD3964429.1 hypothetical protein [Candidatus Moranbacteria bacterium]
MPFFIKNKQRKTVLTSLIFALAMGMIVAGWSHVQPVFAVSTTSPISQIGLSASLFNNENRVINNGTYEVRFALYRVDRETIDLYPSDTDAGSRIWSETQTVTIKSGLLKAFLGSVVPFPSTLNFQDGSYYIGIRIGTDSEMVPRKKLSSVPSALNAQFLQGRTLGTLPGNIPVLGDNGKMDIKSLPTGKGKNQLVLGNDARLKADTNSHAQNTDVSTTSEIFTLGKGKSTASTDFSLNVSEASNTPAIRFNATTQTWQFSNNGSSFGNIASSTVGSYLPLAGGTMLGDIVFAGTQTFTNLINLGSDTIGNYVATISGGDGILGSASSEGATPTLSIDLLTTADGTGATSSHSGLEFAGGASDQLSLLQGCLSGQGIAWNDTTNVWECSTFAGGLAGVGISDYNVYWTGTSTLGSEQFVNVSRGGTGVSGATAGNGTLLIGTGTGYALATLTQGTGITVTNASGSITLATTASTSVVNDTNITGSIASNALTLGWTGQLAVSRGGTGVGSLTSNGLLYGNGTGAVQVTTAGTDAQFLVANLTGVPTFVSMGGDATIANTGALTISADAVALTTDTTGNYVATITNGNGITGSSASEGGTPTLSVNLLTTA